MKNPMRQTIDDPPRDDSTSERHLSENEPDIADDDDGLSLEELSQSYKTVMQSTTASSDAGQAEPATGELHDEELDEQRSSDETGKLTECCPPTPRSILEAILFVGRPDGALVTAAEIAGLMRGVKEAEISVLVDELNEIYSSTNRAVRIAQHGAGYRLQLAEDLHCVKDRFYGRIREVRLNQASIDCLALVSYQPGISREKLDEQLGQSSGTVLNQLVRRQLLEIRRETESNKSTQRYFPTARLLELLGIQSLDDLPQAEDF